jgi:20S proteasome subunit beta 4
MYPCKLHMPLVIAVCLLLDRVVCDLNTLLGLKGKDFVLLGGDTSFFRGMTVMEGSYKKVVQLDTRTAAAAAGEQGDVEVFLDWLQRDLRLRRLSSESLSLAATASVARRSIAESLRTPQRKDVSMLLGGWDSVKGAQLYWLDSLGSLQTVPFGAHGAASAFLLSMLDRSHRADMSLLEAVQLMRGCVKQLSTRFIVAGGGFQMMVIDCSGCKDIGSGEQLLDESSSSSSSSSNESTAAA